MIAARRPSVSAQWSVVAALTVFETARRAHAHRVGPFEERVFRWFNDAPDRILPPAWVVMQSGSLGAVFVVAGGLRCRGRGRAAAVSALVGSAVWVGVKVVKPLVGRGRPDAHLQNVAVRGDHQDGLGYPSGHAAVALTLASIVPRTHCLGAQTAALGLAGITGGARLYVGAHLPLDVAGGLAIGSLAGQAAIMLLDRIAPP